MKPVNFKSLFDLREQIRFEDYIESVWLIYDFKTNDLKLFNRRNRVLLPIVATCCLVELLKSLVNALANNYLLRLYLCDFICTYSNLQSIFDLACGISYSFVIRCFYHMYRNRNNANHLKWLLFLKVNDEKQLVSKYVLNKQEAASFLNQVYLFIWLAKRNVQLFLVLQILLHLRTFLAAYSQLSLSAFFFCTLPNALSFYTVNILCYQASNTFFAIFNLACLFIEKNLKSCSQPAFLNRLKGRRAVEHLARINLKAFKDVLPIFNACQKDIKMNLTAMSSCYLFVCLSFPFVIYHDLAYDNNMFSSLICISLYLQSMLIALFVTIQANMRVAHAFEQYGGFLHQLIPRCSSIALKLKLQNFYMINQRDNPISFKYHDFFLYNNRFFLSYLLESASIFILIYNLN